MPSMFYRLHHICVTSYLCYSVVSNEWENPTHSSGRHSIPSVNSPSGIDDVTDKNGCHRHSTRPFCFLSKIKIGYQYLQNEKYKARRRDYDIDSIH